MAWEMAFSELYYLDILGAIDWIHENILSPCLDFSLEEAFWNMQLCRSPRRGTLLAHSLPNLHRDFRPRKKKS